MKHEISDTQIAIIIIIFAFLICGGFLTLIKSETKYTLENSWKLRDEVYDVYKQNQELNRKLDSLLKIQVKECNQ